MSDNNLKTYKFHVNGMHCNACVLFIEDELSNFPGVSKVKASLGHYSVEVVGDFKDRVPEQIAEMLTEPIKKNGYTLAIEKTVPAKKISEFKFAVPIALGFAVLFVALQKIGLINLIGGESVNLGTAFLVGVVASLSTCMAVVGGLVLSMSATFAKEGDKFKPQVYFHLGRLVSFFILGGVIGAIGSAFTLGTGGTFAMSLFIGLVMLALGINLLDVFPWAKKLQPSMPKFIAKNAHGVAKLNHTLTPVLVGIATFFLPCGFTQSMQLYTLSTGSFIDGALTMFVFALGTLPVLALVSFSSFSINNNARSGVFFKSAGLIVIMFALLNILTSFVSIGLIPPLFEL